MEPTRRTPVRVVVVGGGASGLLVAAHLAREAVDRPVDVTILEPAGRLGRGPAYSTDDPRHLLNVPARGMSALPDDPDHFVAWSGLDPVAFAPRARYGDYLEATLRESWATAPRGSVLSHRRCRATWVDAPPAGPVAVLTDDGATLLADVVVVATGHGAPVTPSWVPVSGRASRRVVLDPWAPGALADVSEGEHIVCVGSGLTAVDVALTVLGGRRRTTVTALSRHGLLPASHVRPLPCPDPPLDLPPGPLRLAPLLRSVRLSGDRWRSAVDGLRPQTQEIWGRLAPVDRDRFARHLSRYWDVHRHRAAPEVGEQIAAWSAEGRFRVVAAERVHPEPARRRLVLTTEAGDIVADRLVVCTGPSADIRATAFGACLVASGVARPGPYGIGVDVDPGTGAMVGATGSADERLVALGPLRRGVLGESTAVPEIRVQAQQLARRLLTDDRVPVGVRPVA